MADELYRTEVVIDVNDQDAIARTERVQQRFDQAVTRMKRLGSSLAQQRIAPMLEVRDRLTQSLLRADQLVKRLSEETAAPVITARDEAQGVLDRINRAVDAVGAGQHYVAVNMRGDILKQIDTAEKAVRQISRVKGSPYSELRGPLLAQLETARTKVNKLDFTKAEPLVSLRDRLSAQLEKVDSRVKALNLQTASPILEARDRVSGVLARVDAMMRALDQGKVDVVADMRGPLMDEIVRAKAALQALSGIKTGPVAELRGQLLGQLAKAQALVQDLDDMTARPEASLLDRVSGAAVGIGNRLRGLTGRTWTVTLRARDMVTGTLRSIMRMAASPLTVFGVGVGAAGIFAGGVLKPLQAAGQMEQARIGFETMLGSAARAQAFLKDLQRFAATTPFEFPELQDASRRLLAFGFSAESIIPTMTAIGNAASGLGIGTEGIDRLILAIGQMRAKAKVSAEEMMQLTEAGIPAWDLLAQAMGKSTAEVMDMTEKGLIPAERAIDILIRGMNQRFPNMMARQSRSLLGLWSTIKDTFNMTVLTRWGDGLSRAIQPRLERLVNMFTKNEDVAKRWGDTLERVAYEAGEAIMSRIESAFNKVERIMKDPRFQQADLFGKTQILWDEIIAKPFDRWWSSGGAEWATGVGISIGSAVGKGAIEALIATLKSNPLVAGLLTAWAGVKLGTLFGTAVGGPIGGAVGAVFGLAAGVGMAGGVAAGRAIFKPDQESAPVVVPEAVQRISATTRSQILMPQAVAQPEGASVAGSPAAATVNRTAAQVVGRAVTPIAQAVGGPGVFLTPTVGTVGYLQRQILTARPTAQTTQAPTWTDLPSLVAQKRIPGHATGTITERPHVALVAERGPEAIIPLSPELRVRALTLWQEVGKRLGVQAFATGGFTQPVRQATPRWLAPMGTARRNENAAPQRPAAAPTVVIHVGPAVERIEVRNASDVDQVAERVARVISRDLRLALANLAG